MIRNVILDVGGVLLTFEPQITLDAFCTSETQKQIVRTALFDSPYWHDADAGHIKDAELFDFAKQNVASEHHEALRQCCTHWDICMEPIAGAREFCRELKAAGVGLYLLSNTSDRFYSYFNKFMPLDFFDGAVISSDVLLMKPDHGIFAYVVDKYQLEKTECLFVDDSLRNVEGARSFGLHAHPFFGDFEVIKNQYFR